MNILIVQTKAFPHRANSFYHFYTQLTEWLTEYGIKSDLFFCYLEVDDSGFENGLLLPDNYAGFYTPRNMEAISRFIDEKKIELILDYSHVIVGDTRKFYLEIKKKYPQIKLFTMIHNCPSHTTQSKAYELKRLRLKDIRSPKQLFQWTLPWVYLYLLKKVVRRQNISAYNTMDEVILLSPSYIPEFKELIGKEDAKRLSAIPNAIKPVKSNIPIKEKKREIVFVGRFAVEKALPKLLKVWEMVQYELPLWKLILVGDGETYKECEKIIKDRRLINVEMKGYQMAIPYIDRASIICLTSVIEGLPTVFVEAMSLGVVPIAFGSFRALYDMIDNGRSGIIIPNDNYKAYAQVLMHLAKDDSWRQELAAAGQKRVAKYDIDYIAPLWLDLFEKHGLI